MKLHKSIEEQIELLKSRGLIISDYEVAKKTLSTINYYRLSGYLFGFRNPDGTYKQGISLNRILDLYVFDAKLTRILMYALENVEETLKTRFSYVLSSSFPENPLVYLDSSIFRNKNEVAKFRSIFEKAKLDNSGLPFIKHHINNYNGDLPIWVAVEIMTMGNIHKLYKNLNGQFQKAIAKLYNTGPTQLQSWIENLTYTRNNLAHYMRIYNYRFGRTPASCRNHIPVSQSGMIFDQIMAVGFMFADKTEWKTYIVGEISKLIVEYQASIDLNDLGFPSNWQTILLSV